MNAIANAPVYDVRTVEKLLGFRYSVAEIDSIGKPPDALPGFVTFFDPGWSILQLRKELIHRGNIFYAQHWYDNKSFAKLEERPSHRQLRMNEVTDSFGKTFAEQQTLLPLDEEVPLARVVVMGMVIHFLATGDRLFAKHYVRCANELSGGSRVFVGYFASDGFFVYRYWDGNRDDRLGLALSVPSRKF